MTTAPPAPPVRLAARPVDDAGRLVHDEDAVAQLALAGRRLERDLADAGRCPADVSRVRLQVLHEAVADEVVEVLLERFAELGVDPEVVVEVGPTDPAGALLGISAELVTPLSGSTPTPTTRTGGSTMSVPTTTPLVPTQATGPGTVSGPVPAERLRGVCEVHLPGDPGYDAARSAWNLAVDQRPAAVAVPRTAEEVADVVRAAAAAGLRVAPQSTGHAAGPLAEQGLADVVVVRLSSLTGVTVDAEAGTARVLGGTLWADVVAAAAPYGLTAMHGSAGDVSVAGYALSGGMSFYGRAHGVAANSIRAVEVVTAEGRVVRTDADHEPELFWGLRGGGGNLGVVVALEIELLPYAEVYAGMLLWDRERAPEVVRAWAEWTRTAPESATTSLRVMSFPPLPELPPFLSGRDLVIVDGAVLEDDDRAAEVLAPLRALAPEMDTFGRIPAAALLAVHMDPPAPTPAVSDHTVLGSLEDGAIEAYLAQVGPGTRSGVLAAEIRHLGGAFAQRPEGAGAIGSLTGEYAMFCVAVAPFPEAVLAGTAATSAVVGAMAPWALASRVPTFTERVVDGSSLFESRERLVALRDRLDPAGLFVANHRL